MSPSPSSSASAVRLSSATGATASSRSDRYDAVIVGARAAGAATGMLLARAGLRVLVVDRAARGTDTTSTHALMRGGVLQLHRWGLLDQLVAAGTPPIRRTTFHIGDEEIPITIKPSYGVDALYAPRRTVLDPILVAAAEAAGAEVRHGVSVTGLLRDDSGTVSGITATDGRGRALSVSAPLTIGADGLASNVARWVDAPTVRRGDAPGGVAYGYWSGYEPDGYEWYFRPGAGVGAIPTNDGEACVYVGTTRERFRRELIADPMSGFLALLAESAPDLLDRLRGARPPRHLVRFRGAAGHIRRPYGPGWALVGDAGYFKDPISAHGITDALRDAELLARAVVDAFGGSDEEAELARYQTTRDRLSSALFETTEAIAAYNWSTEEIRELLLQLSSAMTDEVEFLAGLDEPLSLAATG